MSNGQDSASIVPSPDAGGTVAVSSAAASRLPPLATVGAILRANPNLGLFAATFAFIVATGILNPAFASEVNLRSLARDWAILMAASIGGMIVILVGGIDLSVSANIALVSVSASILSNSVGPALALTLGVVMGLGVGAINGILVAYLKIDSVIATIGTLQILTGAAFVWSNGAPVQANSQSFSNLGGGLLFSRIAYPTLILIPLVIVAYLFLKRTVWGRYMYAIGGSEDAARACGISVARYKALAFVLSGGLAAFAGVMLASRVGGASATLGSDILITSVAAIFIGGVNFGGGIGGIGGVTVGALLLTALRNGLSFYGISSFFEMIITGLVLILALYANRLRRSRW